MTQTQNHLLILRRINKLKAEVARFEASLLELMAHPDATPEMIETSRAAYLRINEHLHDVSQKVWKSTNGRVRL